MDKKIIKRKLEGEITSDKMDKTVTVNVTTIKRYKSTRKYKAHDAKNEYKIGDTVVIEECRPISKDKCWRVISKSKVTSNK